MHPRLTSRRFSATPLLFLLSTTFVYTAPSRAAEPAVKLDALVTEISSHHPELAFYAAEIAAARTHAAHLLHAVLKEAFAPAAKVAA